MTVGDTARVRAGTQRIMAACTPSVQADIDELLTRADKPEWVASATHALKARYDSPLAPRPAVLALEGVAEARIAEPPMIGVEETIVRALGTPVFLVENNAVDVASGRSEAKAWRKTLTENAATVNRLMASIGRVDVANLDDREFLGTAWVIDEGLVVTNRHVANFFAQSSGIGFTFRLGFDTRHPIGVNVDFLEEFGNTAADEIAIERIVWVAPENGPDVAFLKLADGSGPGGRVTLELATEPPPKDLPVAVIGYPARDPNFSDAELAEKIFGGVFDKKRLAVGQVIGVGGDLLTHSCSTLGGNSGSPVVDVGTGHVIGLHCRGIEFIQNEAIPATVVKRCLTVARGLVARPDVMRESVTVSEDVGGTSNGITFTVPLKITVEIGGSGAGPAIVSASSGAKSSEGKGELPSASRPPTDGPVDREKVQEAVRIAYAMLSNRDDVVAIRPGYRFENGEITDERAVVVSVKRKVDPEALEGRGITPLPDYVDGVRVDVTVASTADLLGFTIDEAAQPSWHTSYKERPDLPLKRRKAKMRFIIHSSPDAGWPQLGPFLKKTRKSLTIAMYDFGAHNVLAGVLDAVKAANESISMVLQMGGHKHVEDYFDREVVAKIREKKAKKFSFAPASIGSHGIFDSAYHIKVAVRDHTGMWLSSGNWQISNQPAIDPLANPDDKRGALTKYNREWHAIIEDEVLAKLYEDHILRDLEDAKAVEEAPAADEALVYVPANIPSEVMEAVTTPQFFEPLIGERVIDVQPILTPDNYIEKVLPFLQSAKTSIHFQNQSFNTRVVGPEYKKLLDTLVEKQKAGLDVKIIFRSFSSGDDREVVEFARDYGFKDVGSIIRKQNNCHTKGIIVDGKAVLMGSHNWTTAGTGFNRDASLIFYDREIAQFYEALFDYDWSRIKPFKIDESAPPPIIVKPGNEAAPPPGYIAVPRSTMLGR